MWHAQRFGRLGKFIEESFVIESIKKQPAFFQAFFPWLFIVAVWVGVSRVTSSSSWILLETMKFADSAFILMLAICFFLFWRRVETCAFAKTIYVLLAAALFLLFSANIVYTGVHNIFHLSSGKIVAFWSLVDDTFFTGYLFFSAVSFSLVLFRTKIKKSINFYIPVVLIAALLLAVFFYGVRWDNVPSVTLTFYGFAEKILEIAFIVVLFFCITTSKNKGFSYLAVGFFVSTITETILSIGINSQNYGTGSIVESGWVMGKLLMLSGVVILAKSKSFKSVDQWLSPPDSIRAQTSYWLFIISMVLVAVFLLLVKLIFPNVFSFNKQLLPILPAVLIIYTVFAAILCNLAAKKFAHPFQKFQDMIDSFQGARKSDVSTKNENLCLAEFRQLQDFLEHTFSALQEKNESEKSCNALAAQVSLASQVAHDIRSPLASLLMIAKKCTDIPEEQRIAIREATTNISDIANNLLSKYKKTEQVATLEERQPILASLLLLQILTDKKYQYQNLPVKFACEFSENSHFVFINAQATSFKRMVSNLINNAVEALEGKAGEIKLHLCVDEQVKIIIEDNGKGMPEEIVNKIANNMKVVSNKKDGHGIGLVQICETLRNNEGQMSIDSKVGVGTKITLMFSKVNSPSWIADQIELHKGGIAVILDDDSSIHKAWEVKFKSHIAAEDCVQVQHFTMATDAVNFINATEFKNKTLLLSDYELLGQGTNGLDVIAQTKIPHSILVTSHHADKTVQELAAKAGIKILPKQLASDIRVVLKTEVSNIAHKKIDIVIIDDDKMLLNALGSFFRGKITDKYSNPFAFLENLAQYSKDTIIFMDHDMGCEMDGFALAAKLHEAGYTQLYMLSGMSFAEQELPHYLKAIMKTDLDAIEEVVASYGKQP